MTDAALDSRGVLQIADVWDQMLFLIPLFKEYARVYRVAKLLIQAHTLLLEERKI